MLHGTVPMSFIRTKQLCPRLTVTAMLIGGVLMVSGCPQESAVWLAPGSTATHLVFMIGRDRGDEDGSTSVTTFDVTTCSDPDRTYANRYWGIERGGNDLPLHVVQYGIVPKGFGQHHPALPLTPGCYRVRLSGTGRLKFNVSRDGSVAEVQD